jgi:hypothetical protein
MLERNLYCVVYRTGGYANFKWHRTLPVTSFKEAAEQCDSVTRQGYRGYVAYYDLSMSIGLPDTFAP